ncbi:hypothetical protein LCGC14_1466660 [marine sediment metagenome]|uniref:Uncharacterized protein n=1 Tax=marine sediment metagenome TaxID=412755 RepID=A0A0F9JZK8_9ZZZZ
MKHKVLEIEKCEDCPYSRNPGLVVACCSIPDKNGVLRGVNGGFGTPPSDCPFHKETLLLKLKGVT